VGCYTTNNISFCAVTVAGDPKIHGKRNYQKPDYCVYCKSKYTSKISAHLMSSHCKEAKVKEIMALLVGF
jgi:hypothetical protein